MQRFEEVLVVLEEVGSRKIPTDAYFSGLFKNIAKSSGSDPDVSVLNACIEALSYAQRLQSFREANTDTEIATAETHKLMKRHLNELFIELAFPCVTSRSVEEISTDLATHFGEEVMVLVRSTMLNAFRKSGRQIVYNSTKDIRRKARSKARTGRATMKRLFCDLHDIGEPMNVDVPTGFHMDAASCLGASNGDARCALIQIFSEQ